MMGLIGGMSWESTLEYYRIINETVKERRGMLHSAKCVLYSVDFGEVEPLQHEGRWEELATYLTHAARKLEEADADFILICTNTMHKLADDIAAHINIPLLHIGDTVAELIRERGIRTVGLLGTRFTMEEDFYKGRLGRKYGIDVMIPDSSEREMVHSVIYNELCKGLINQSSKKKFRDTIDRLHEQGAQGVILGCTEIPLLISQEDADIPLFDTTAIHAKAAVDYALK
jgi:aspartate racemase